MALTRSVAINIYCLACTGLTPIHCSVYPQPSLSILPPYSSISHWPSSLISTKMSLATPTSTPASDKGSGTRLSADEDATHDGATHEDDCSGQLYAWPRIRHHCRDTFSEFLGTFILVLFGDGVVAQVKLSKDAAGNWQSINWGWGYDNFSLPVIAQVFPRTTICVFSSHVSAY